MPIIEIKRILCPADFSDCSRHALEHAVVLCGHDTITVEYLPVHIRTAPRTPDSFCGEGQGSRTRDLIVQALEKTAWNKKRAARILGIDRKTLYRNIAKYRIPVPSRDESTPWSGGGHTLLS